MPSLLHVRDLSFSPQILFDFRPCGMAKAGEFEVELLDAWVVTSDIILNILN